MLVLSRKIGERIIVGSEIEITVMDVHGKRVKLGVAAPSDVRIQRIERLSQCAQETLGELSDPIGAQSSVGATLACHGKS
jgi:carbon storage regulator